MAGTNHRSGEHCKVLKKNVGVDISQSGGIDGFIFHIFEVENTDGSMDKWFDQQ